jgi:hypothetical protein
LLAGELGPVVGDLDVFSLPFLFQNAAYTDKALWTRATGNLRCRRRFFDQPGHSALPPAGHPATTLFGGEM